MRQVTLFYRMMVTSLLFPQAKRQNTTASKSTRLPSKVQEAIKVFEYEGWEYLNRFTLDKRFGSEDVSQPARSEAFELLLRSPTDYNYLLVVQPDGTIEDVKPI